MTNQQTEFKQMPGFSKYEISRTGLIRNIATKQLVSTDITGRKVRLYNDNATRETINVHEMKDKVFPVKSVTPPVEKQKKAIKEVSDRTKAQAKNLRNESSVTDETIVPERTGSVEKQTTSVRVNVDKELSSPKVQLILKKDMKITYKIWHLHKLGYSVLQIVNILA